MPDSSSSSEIDQNKRLKNTDLDKRARGGRKSRTTKDDNIIPLDANILDQSQLVQKEMVTDQEMSTLSSDSEPMRAKVVADDQSAADTQEGKSDSSSSSSETMGAALNQGTSDRPIFGEDPKMTTSPKRSASAVKSEDKKPLNSDRVSNDPRINPRKAAQSPVLEEASKIPSEPYPADEKRVLPASHPSQLGRANNDPRREGKQ